MKLKIDDIIPNTDIYKIGSSGPQKIKSYEIFQNKKILLVGVPGAFTPTCSLEHLPGFTDKVQEFKNKGIEEIIFMSVNDPFVMDEWRKSKNEDKISFFSDPFCEFGKKIGFTLDLTEIGLGLRLSRFAMLVENKKIKIIFDEEGGGLNKSSADFVLKAL